MILLPTMKFDREVSIVGDVRDLHGQVCPFDAEPALPERSEDDQREVRREFYILMSAVTDKVIDTFLQDTADLPVGLYARVDSYSGKIDKSVETKPLVPATLRDSLYPYRLLQDCLAVTGAQVPYLRERPSYEVKYRELLERVDEIGPRVSLTKDNPEDRYAEAQAKVGLATAFQFMPRICEAIETLVQQRADGAASAADIANVARRSETAVTRLAALGFIEVGFVHHRLTRTGDPDLFGERISKLFTLEDSRDGLRVIPAPELSAPTPLTLQKQLENMARLDYRTIGCPAMIRANGRSPIGNLWARVVTICEQTMWRQNELQRTVRRDPLETPQGFDV